MATMTRKPRTLHPYYRTADGWYYAVSQRFLVPFGTKRVKLLKAPSTPDNEQLAIVELRKLLSTMEVEQKGDGITIGVLAERYLSHLEQSGCTPQHFAQSKRLLEGFTTLYGAQSIATFSQTAAYKLDQWLAVHKKWKSVNSRFRALVCVKSMFNYGSTRLNITNPIRGKNYSLPKTTARVTWYTPEQEQAILATLRLPRFHDRGHEFADLFAALIATGARTFVELGAFTRSKLLFERGKPIAFAMGEVKGKDRTVYLTPDMSAVVERLMVKYPQGPLFRNSKGGRWTCGNAGTRLRKVIQYLIKTRPDLNLTTDHCLYSCRHSFAVRMLEATGGDISRVADLMGNTVSTVQKHYAKWGIHRRECLAALGWNSAPTPDLRVCG